MNNTVRTEGNLQHDSFCTDEETEELTVNIECIHLGGFVRDYVSFTCR